MHRLFSLRATASAAILLIVAMFVGELQAGDGTSPTSTALPEQVLLLVDGGVLTGQITRDGERYVVTHAGSEMQIGASRVMFVCNSLADAYQKRREKMTSPGAKAHLALADWCIRYGLRAQAEIELADARGLEPHHPYLALLERRIARSNKQSTAPKSASAVVQASAQQVTEPSSSAGMDLPQGVVERFTRKVQPVLVNNCTTAQCHQSGGPQKFQLDRAILRGMANRQTTMRNLAATLALVDRANPELSPLVIVPRRRHGGMDAPVFGQRQEQAFKHLVDWVNLIAPPKGLSKSTEPVEQNLGAGPPDNARSIYTRSPILRVPAANIAASSDSAKQDMPGAREEAEAETSDGFSDTDFVTPRQTAPMLKYGARVESWQPRDEFDPEIFNRQQHARNRAVERQAINVPDKRR